MAGALVGLGFLSKLSAAALVPVLALVLLFRVFQVGPGLGAWTERLRRALRMGIGIGVGTLAVCGWWLVRNILTYGEITGTRAAFQFYQGKFALVDYDILESRAESLQSTWQSIWGRFGWMDVNLPGDFYDQAGQYTLTLFGLSALAASWFMGRWVIKGMKVWRRRRYDTRHSFEVLPTPLIGATEKPRDLGQASESSTSPLESVAKQKRNSRSLGSFWRWLVKPQWIQTRVRTGVVVPTHFWQAIIVMLSVAALLIRAYIEFNETVARQPQGGYLFLLLLPAALLFTGGVYAIAPGRWLKVAALAVPILWLAWMNLTGLIVINSIR